MKGRGRIRGRFGIIRGKSGADGLPQEDERIM